METRDTHILSFKRQVYNHTLGLVVTGRVIGGWIGSDWVNCRCRLESCMQVNVRQGSRHDFWCSGIYELVENKFQWLLQLMDFREEGRLNEGSVVLVTLYWEMFRAKKPHKIKIDGCM
ncbi:hypothetical protein PVK06_035638 [Gossypium arboreum]|uniref:Uncharacterized protein n=1 Tax=Gossypium arboreum TaxID=29729 RepID=A0ABR0NHC7_GOSAR|nr:hypothetical protein PVK06_035638 [Gossypium arboreum]